jgi:Putative Actinobacterial Holin-X, holin superfamily III
MESREHEGNDRDRLDETSLSELMRQLSDQTSRLARQEVELAKAELTDKGRTLGIGLGEFGAAGLLAVLALGALTATLILALSEAVDGWLAALIVTVVYLAVAGLLALAGKRKAEEATPPAPERAQASVKQDVTAIKQGAKAGRA